MTYSDDVLDSISDTGADHYRTKQWAERFHWFSSPFSLSLRVPQKGPCRHDTPAEFDGFAEAASNGQPHVDLLVTV